MVYNKKITRGLTMVECRQCSKYDKIVINNSQLSVLTFEREAEKAFTFKTQSANFGSIFCIDRHLFVLENVLSLNVLIRCMRIEKLKCSFSRFRCFKASLKPGLARSNTRLNQFKTGLNQFKTGLNQFKTRLKLG